MLNTAVLTGRQVSDPLKVLMVSQAGDIADVTLGTSCTTNDDSALKVGGTRGIQNPRHFVFEQNVKYELKNINGHDKLTH